MKQEDDIMVVIILLKVAVCYQRKVSAAIPESVLCEDAFFFNPSQGTVNVEQYA